MKGQIPAFMSSFAKLFAEQKYVINPAVGLVEREASSLALQQNQVGLITGQRSIDDILNAMDAAWKQGPA